MVNSPSMELYSNVLMEVANLTTSIPSVVPSTISRRLSEAGLRSQRPLRRLPLTPQHRRSRLEWSHSRSSWLPLDYHHVVFSDESRLTLEADDHRVRVWKGRGQRSQSAFVLQRHTAITPGVMVWGAISYDSRSSLVILRTSLTVQRYIDTILRPVALRFMARHPGAIFQQDNARPHTARIYLDCLHAVDILPWPARSLDLSPVEHVWDMVDRQIRAPQNIANLERQLMNAWQNVSEDDIRNLYHSSPRRIQACIATRSGSTNY
ncbi:Transposable element Tc1 transposase, partial [Stegodyphus mimosarum]